MLFLWIQGFITVRSPPLQIEIATGKFPYPKWNSVFDQLTQVVNGEPPQLSDNDDRFTHEFINFVNTWYVLLALTLSLPLFSVSKINWCIFAPLALRIKRILFCTNNIMRIGATIFQHDFCHDARM